MENNPATLKESAERTISSQENVHMNEDIKAEEEKLKAKYANLRGSGHSVFLQKKLAKGQKFFDSGDYQMAKQNICKAKIDKAPQSHLKFGTGETIPTPETVPVRKASIIQQQKFTPAT